MFGPMRFKFLMLDPGVPVRLNYVESQECQEKDKETGADPDQTLKNGILVLHALYAERCR